MGEMREHRGWRPYSSPCGIHPDDAAQCAPTSFGTVGHVFPRPPGFVAGAACACGARKAVVWNSGEVVEFLAMEEIE